METCPECDGRGVRYEDTPDEHRCDYCGGTGYVRPRDDHDDDGALRT
jgi:DnaJ-class molecular chaperone